MRDSRKAALIVLVVVLLGHEHSDLFDADPATCEQRVAGLLDPCPGP